MRAGATLLSANANLIRPIRQDSWRMEVDSTSLPRSPDPSLPCLAQVHPSLIHPCAVLPKPIQALSTPVLSYPSPSKLIHPCPVLPKPIHPCTVLPKPIQTYPTYPSPLVHSVFFEPVYFISYNLIHFYTVHPLLSHMIQSNPMQFKMICSIPSILVKTYQTLSTQSNVFLYLGTLDI